jgi:hypothetical protein
MVRWGGYEEENIAAGAANFLRNPLDNSAFMQYTPSLAFATGVPRLEGE